ncbi:MAG: class E sortase [Actinomycetota bacterium]|nr:class E sortase [Actinomycetota bacterium]
MPPPFDPRLAPCRLGPARPRRPEGRACRRPSRVPAALRVLVATGLLIGVGAFLVERGRGALAALDQPGPGPAPAAAGILPVAVPPTTAPPPTIPVVGGEGLPAQPERPIDIPSNPYASEKLVEIGTIEIPRIGLFHRVFHGVTLRSIDQGPAHWPGTAFPGQTGNSVFAGHRVTHSHPFRNLDQLVSGDRVIFHVGGVRSVYAVTGSEVVSPQAVHIANPTPTPTATLYACHPPGSARYRYVVHLALVGPPA